MCPSKIVSSPPPPPPSHATMASDLAQYKPIGPVNTGNTFCIVFIERTRLRQDMYAMYSYLRKGLRLFSMFSNQLFHYACCITPKRVTSFQGPFPRHSA